MKAATYLADYDRRDYARPRHRNKGIIFTAIPALAKTGNHADEPDTLCLTPSLRSAGAESLALFAKFFCSQQFSIVALTDGSGAITERYAYSAYGEPVFCNSGGTDIGASAEDNRVLYTGREWDEELKLYHFRARLYDAEVGRFWGRDPINFTTVRGSYMAEMLLDMLDPTGNNSIDLDIEHSFDKCVGCGGVEESISFSVSEIGGERPYILGQYAVIQYICSKRSGTMCSSECGQNCTADKDRPVPKMDCCGFELLGVIQVWRAKTEMLCIGHNGKGLMPCKDGKIGDSWGFKSFGDSKCHSKGVYAHDSKVGVFDIEDWEQIWTMINDYAPKDYPCGDQTTTRGPGPKKEDFNGHAQVRIVHYGSWGTWDCCPKKEGKSVCTNEFNMKEIVPRTPSVTE